MRIYDKLSWVRIVEQELKGYESVLDLGCGGNSPLQACKVPYLVGVDVFTPYLEESSKKAIHSEYIKADVRTVEFQNKSFDGVFAIEILEHLTKDEGSELLEKMSLWARKKVIITTPNGYILQEKFDDNPYQVHKSGWTVSELQRCGFKVHGMNSWKFLRGSRGIVKLKPAVFWEAFSILMQPIAYYCPRWAFQLLAVKKVKDA
jgi:SAM-dependent methyltransferase